MAREIDFLYKCKDEEIADSKSWVYFWKNIFLNFPHWAEWKVGENFPNTYLGSAWTEVKTCIIIIISIIVTLRCLLATQIGCTHPWFVNRRTNVGKRFWNDVVNWGIAKCTANIQLRNFQSTGRKHIIRFFVW